MSDFTRAFVKRKENVLSALKTSKIGQLRKIWLIECVPLHMFEFSVTKLRFFSFFTEI